MRRWMSLLRVAARIVYMWSGLSEAHTRFQSPSSSSSHTLSLSKWGNAVVIGSMASMVVSGSTMSNVGLRGHVMMHGLVDSEWRAERGDGSRLQSALSGVAPWFGLRLVSRLEPALVLVWRSGVASHDEFGGLLLSDEQMTEIRTKSASVKPELATDTGEEGVAGSRVGNCGVAMGSEVEDVEAVSEVEAELLLLGLVGVASGGGSSDGAVNMSVCRRSLELKLST